MEWLSGILPISLLLFIPVALLSGVLFEEWMHRHLYRDAFGHPLTHELLENVQKMQAYLNPTFFFIRAAIFFGAWIFLSVLFNRTSREQDVTGDPSLTNKLEKWSAPAIFIFALTLTFAAFDWIMSLKAEWYSTIFGVYVFSGSVTGSLALLALVTMGLQRTGLLGNVSTVEHRHDIGKLLFGFTIFWAYIGFSQFFLIWYANIPEETIFYAMRWGVNSMGEYAAWNSWKPVSLLLLFGHFWVPFFLLLSRHTKRSYIGLTIGAIIMLVMHYVDVYWMVMPNLDGKFTPTWIDFAGLLGPVGVLCAWMSYRASRDPLYPLRDPRLPEAVQLVNL